MSDALPVVVVTGPAGSGKSTLARALALGLPAAHLDKDVVCGALVDGWLAAAGEPLDDRDSPDGFYQRHIRAVEYHTLAAVAGDVLRSGVGVVLDAPFVAELGHPDHLARMIADHRWPEVDCVVVTVSVPPEELRRRVAARGIARDRWKLTHWDAYAATLAAPAVTWPGVTVLTTDGDTAVTRTIAAVRAALRC